MRWLIGLVVFLIPALAAAASTGASITLICPLPVVALAAVGAAMVAGGVAASVKGAMSGYSGNYQPNQSMYQGDWHQSNQTRGEQQGYLSMMEDQVRGRGPSIAQDQLRSGLGQALQQQRGQAAMATSANRGLAERTASMNMGQMGQQTAADSAMLRAQEMLAGRQQLGEGLLGVRGQDIGQANAQLQANVQEQQAALEAEKLKADAENKKSDRWTQLGGALISGGGRMLGAAGG